jgi:hypothetical protein
MKTLTAYPQRGTDILLITSWDELKEKASLILRRCVVEGIRLFYNPSSQNSEEEIFNFLIGLPNNGLEIWADLEYFGGHDEGYFTRMMIDSFLEKNKHDDAKIEMYQVFIKKPKPLKHD